MDDRIDKGGKRVRRMFDGIARRYDLLNRLLSGCRDRYWRRKTAEVLAERPGRAVLDRCGGTGDLSLEIARTSPERWVICCDFSHRMLERAGSKFGGRSSGERCVLLEADALRLPLPDAAVDAVCLAFGVRNFEDLDAGLIEILRVLRPGGQLVVLEFSVPTAPVLRSLYGFYLGRILPLVGDGVSGRSGPYRYLARTIADFPDPAALARRVRDAGFAECDWTPLTGGIVAIHHAIKAR